ncbi:MAG: bifunctional glycosyltransferase/class I SAM-dependent methyltransferase [Nitrospinota bacterium]|nr:bifunctional glycosyltransferase/class I SAM-dependent methyltransferase [Nitrospinota bacterium]
MTAHENLVSVLMPAFNERGYIRKCAERVLSVQLPKGLKIELIIVNDASTDGTGKVVDDLAKSYPAQIRGFHQPKNMGKGAAIRRAIAEANGRYIIFQDADMEYDPNEYPRLLKPIIDGHADVVYGSRFMPREMTRVLNYHHTLGNRFLTFLSNILTGLNLTDMETCYKAFKADILKTIPIRSNRFGMEPELTAKVARRNCVVYEVPINYHGRTYAEGKKINWKDGVSAIYTIIKYYILDDCYEERYGHDILASMALARRFNAWMVDVILPHFGTRILEVGSGIGNISRLLPKKERLTVTDNDPVYVEILQDAFANNEVVDVAKLDLNSDEDFANLKKGYDTIVCLNVLEHIDDDRSAVLRMFNLLDEGGKLCLLVPQYKWLYGSYDREVLHVRRYGKRQLRSLLEECGFKVTTAHGFNFPSMFGWWLNSVVLRRKRMGKVQLKIFDMLVPVFKIVEKILPLPGLSLIMIAEKPSAPTQEQ